MATGTPCIELTIGDWPPVEAEARESLSAELDRLSRIGGFNFKHLSDSVQLSTWDPTIIENIEADGGLPQLAREFGMPASLRSYEMPPSPEQVAWDALPRWKRAWYRLRGRVWMARGSAKVRFWLACRPFMMLWHEVAQFVKGKLAPSTAQSPVPPCVTVTTARASIQVNLEELEKRLRFNDGWRIFEIANDLLVGREHGQRAVDDPWDWETYVLHDADALRRQLRAWLLARRRPDLAREYR